MAQGTALAKREIALERREMGIRHRLSKQAMTKTLDQIKLAAKKKIDGAVENEKTSVVLNAGARLGAMAAEAYAKKHAPNVQKYMGPAGAIASAVFYTLALTTDKGAERTAYIGLAGAGDGASSRFVIETLDKLF